MRNLDRLRARPDVIEVDELAVVFGFLPSPISFIARICSLIRFPPPKGLDSMVPQLFHEPTGTDAEQDAPTGQVINRGHLIGQYDRVPRWDGTDPGAKLQARGESGGQRT